MPTAEELGLTNTPSTATGPVDDKAKDGVATSQGSTSQLPDDEKAKDENEFDKQNDNSSDFSGDDGVDGPDTDDLDLDDGYTGPKSIAADEPLDGPSHNNEGHRNVVADQSGNATVLDDDTARVLYENPKFYEEVFHNGRSYPVKQLTWANSKGNTVSAEPVGEGYELGK